LIATLAAVVGKAHGYRLIIPEVPPVTTTFVPLRPDIPERCGRGSMADAACAMGCRP
jgi:hypothetical protein